MIRGVSEEGEDLTDLIPSMEKLFNSVGLTLKENETTFKSTYDIIKDLSSIWETLTDMKRANILESVAGKRQGQIVAAMISNFESAEEALKTAQNSAGSAEAEFNRAMDSIEFKSNQLAQTFTGLWQKAVDRETIKSFLDSMISMAEAIDYLVNNPISKFLISSAALVGTLKLASMGIIALGKSTIGTAAGVIALDIAEKGLLKTTVALTKAMWKSPFFKVMVVITAVTAIVKIVQYLNSSLDRQKEKVEELSQSYKDLQLELDSVNTELKDITSRIDELDNKDSLSLVEQDELEKLQITNRELQQKIELLEREAELTASDSGKEVVKLYKDTYKPVSRERIDELRDTNANVPLKDRDKDINALIAAYENFRDLRDESLSDEEFVFYNDILKDIERSLIDDSKELMNFRDILRDLPDPTEEQLNILDEINNTLKFTRSIISPKQLFSDTWNKLEKEQREYIKSLVENNKFTEQQARDYEELDDLLNVIGFSFDKLSDYIENQIESQTELNDYLDFTVKKTEELDDLYKNLTDTIKYINNLNHDYAKNQSLTAEQVEELIQRYPQLTSYIHKTADGWKIEGKALKELNNIREDSVKIAVLAQAGITEASYKNLRERLELYGIEIESITGIADAYKVMMSYMASGASSETVGAVLEYGKALERIRGLQEALSDPNYGISKSTSSSKSATEVYRAQVNILYELEEQLRRVNIALERNQILTNLADESEKNQLYNERIGLLRQQQDALHQINEARRKMIRDINNQLSSAGFQIDYNAQLNELMIKNMKYLSNFTDDAAKEYENLIKKVLDLNEANQDSSTKWLQIEQDIESVIESMISLNEANKDVIATVESKIMDIIRKRYEEQGKIREEEYKKEKEALNNSLNEYRSYVQDMLDEMDRLYNTEDYEKQIQKQSQAIMDIQSDINKLSLAAESGDMDAQTKINDLRKKLDEEREKLVEIQTKRERDLRKQNLQDSIKDYEENTKKQIEILDKEYEDFQSKLDSKLSEENIYLETRKAMMTGHIHAINDDLETVEYKFEDIETAYINFENRFGEGLSLLGNKIKSEFIDNIQLAKKAILQLQDVTVGSGSIEIEKAKEQIGVLQTLWNTVEDDKKRKEYADEADRLRKKYGLEFEDLRGYTGVYNSNSTTSQISNPSSTLSNLVKNIPKFILNPLDNVANKIPQYTTKTSSSNNDIKLSLNFPNIIGEMNKSKIGDIANELFGRFRLELKKLGVQL